MEADDEEIGYSRATALGFVQGSRNVTAFCKLTGKKVADCSCTRCTASRHKAKA